MLVVKTEFQVRNKMLKTIKFTEKRKQSSAFCKTGSKINVARIAKRRSQLCNKFKKILFC